MASTSFLYLFFGGVAKDADTVSIEDVLEADTSGFGRASLPPAIWSKSNLFLISWNGCPFLLPAKGPAAIFLVVAHSAILDLGRPPEDPVIGQLFIVRIQFEANEVATMFGRYQSYRTGSGEWI
jgi:hypothetical protein